MILYTVGHSNRSLSEFTEILQAHGIRKIIDVRTIPRSRRMPWFGQNALKKSLAKLKITYEHLPALGGLRKTKKDSVNLGWHNTSFRGFADYMATADFFYGLKKLNAIIKKGRKKTAILCAEAVPWRCHRNLIADAEIIRGIKVVHLLSKTNTKKHELTSFAVVDRTKRPLRIYYPDTKSS